jgi:hypothetical protein
MGLAKAHPERIVTTVHVFDNIANEGEKFDAQSKCRNSSSDPAKTSYIHFRGEGVSRAHRHQSVTHCIFFLEGQNKTSAWLNPECEVRLSLARNGTVSLVCGMRFELSL